jgi:hypothetical protein
VLVLGKIVNSLVVLAHLALNIFILQTAMPGGEGKLPEGPLVWHGAKVEVSFLHRDFSKINDDSFRSNRSGLLLRFAEIESENADELQIKDVTKKLVAKLLGEEDRQIELGERPRRSDQPRSIKIYSKNSGYSQPVAIGFIASNKIDMGTTLVMLFLVRENSFSPQATSEMNFCLSTVEVK